MPRYTVEYNGKRYTVEGDAPPTETDMAETAGGGSSPDLFSGGAINALSRGMSFGTAAPIASAAHAAFGKGEGDTFAERYSDNLNRTNREYDAYSEAHPVATLGAELLGGGGLTGGLRALAGRVAPVALAKATAMAVARPMQTLAATGAVTSAGYGATTADEGERTDDLLMNAGIGAAAGPALGFAVKSGANIGANVLEKARGLLTSTDKSRADEYIRQIARDNELTNAEVKQLYQELGPEGTLMDVDPALGQAGRAVYDAGGARRTMGDMLHTRKEGEQGRLLDALYAGTGLGADSSRRGLAAMQEARSAQASPLYKIAFETDLEPSAALQQVMQRDAVKRAIPAGDAISSNRGELPGSPRTLMRRLHDTKMAMDAKITTAIARDQGKVTNTTAGLLDAKNALLAEMDKVSPEYGQARQIWADGSALSDAAEIGSNMLRMSPNEINILTKGMTAGERDAFKAGAVETITGKLGDTQLSADAVKKLLGTTNLKERMAGLFDSDAAFNQFVNAAGREQKFQQTKNIVTGGSKTSTNQAGSDALEDAAAAGDILTGGKAGIAIAVAKKLLGKQDLTNGMVRELDSVLANPNLTDAQLDVIMKDPTLARVLRQKMKTAPMGTGLVAGQQAGDR